VSRVTLTTGVIGDYCEAVARSITEFDLCQGSSRDKAIKETQYIYMFIYKDGGA